MRNLQLQVRLTLVLVSSPNLFRPFVILKGLKINPDNSAVSYGGISAQLRNKFIIQQTKKSDLEDWEMQSVISAGFYWLWNEKVATEGMMARTARAAPGEQSANRDTWSRKAQIWFHFSFLLFSFLTFSSVNCHHGSSNMCMCAANKERLLFASICQSFILETRGRCCICISDRVCAQLYQLCSNTCFLY